MCNTRCCKHTFDGYRPRQPEGPGEGELPPLGVHIARVVKGTEGAPALKAFRDESLFLRGIMDAPLSGELTWRLRCEPDDPGVPGHTGLVVKIGDVAQHRHLSGCEKDYDGDRCACGQPGHPLDPWVIKKRWIYLEELEHPVPGGFSLWRHVGRTFVPCRGGCGYFFDLGVLPTPKDHLERTGCDMVLPGCAPAEAVLCFTHCFYCGGQLDLRTLERSAWLCPTCSGDYDQVRKHCLHQGCGTEMPEGNVGYCAVHENIPHYEGQDDAVVEELRHYGYEGVAIGRQDDEWPGGGEPER